MVKIKTVATETPEYTSTTAETIPYIKKWLANEDERFQRKVIKIFEGAQVDRRYAIMPPEEVFTPTSFEDKNEIYKSAAQELGRSVLEKALHQADWKLIR